MSKCILIVEDDPSIAELERDYLMISGYDVQIAATGERGLIMALSEDYALILLDVMLPGMDGFTICRKIRETSETPVLLVTAKKEPLDKIRGLGLGADDYIVKPFDPGELVARVNSHIARYERLTAKSGEQKEQALQFGALRLIPQAWRVFLGENELKLTTKEFEVLLLLAENPNVVFSKERIFDRVWGVDSMGDASTVAVHINRIRDKFGEIDSGARYIETVWGAGYRFQAG